MNGKRILVSGLTNIEHSVNVHSFPIDYSPIQYAFDESSIAVAGTAYNIACALSRLGDEVDYTTVLGRDPISDWVHNTLRQQGLRSINAFPLLERTCSSTVLFDDAGRRKIYCDLRDIQDLVLPIGSFRENLEACDGVIVTNINFNDALIRGARQFGKPVFTDVHVLHDIHDPYNRRFMENADVLFLSDEGLPTEPEEFLLAIWREYHSQVIVLGRGDKGALLFDGQTREFHYQEAVYTRPIVNTVGAGDALFSAFVHFYLKGDSSFESLKKATYFASYKIGESGGSVGFPSEKDLLDLLPTH